VSSDETKGEASPGAHEDRGVPLVGELAPDFTLPDERGEAVHLRDFLGKQVVLYFYPKDDTPGCTVEACGFRDAWQEMQAEGTLVLGISRDSVKSHQKFATKYGLPFTLLADVDGNVSRLYGVWVQKQRYGRSYMSVARTTFYIRPDGRVGHVWTNVKPEGHALRVFEFVSKN
jgi:peroxiredoxin Q/BCP